MKLDLKETVLVAFYIEYQQDIPDMSKVNCNSLNITEEKFDACIRKLLNEGYLTNVKTWSGDNKDEYFTQDALVTRDGLDYVETKLNIARETTAIEKVSKVAEKAKEWGLEQLKELASNVIADLIKKTIGL